MRVALVNPQTETSAMREIYGYHENLGIGLMASNLKANGHETFILDLRVHKLNEIQAAEFVVGNNIKLIGFSVNYATLPSALKMAQIIKLKRSDCIIVVGGEHATYLDEEILREYAAVDYISRGEGEITLVELADRLKNNEPMDSVEGISYIDSDKKLIRTPNRKSIRNLDALPFASREVALNALENNIPVEIGILAQRGCPFLCSFCNAFRFLANDEPTMRIRTRSALNVVNEMEALSPLLEKHHLILRFYDATFVTRSDENRKWINEFCRLLEERKIKIPFDAFVRSDSFDFDKDGDLIARLKNVGLVGTYVGLEAGDDVTLEVYNKGVECSDSFQTMFNLRKFGIEGATNGVICFHQSVTLQEIRNSILFLKQLGFCTSWNIASRAETLPGIELEKEMELFPRETVWDVENYYFSDDKVSLLYNAIKKLKTKYFISQYEDNITRKLREALKLRQFYERDNTGLEAVKASLEKDIANVQAITARFFVDMLDSIEKNDEIQLSHLDLEIKSYVHVMMPNLLKLWDKYSHLLPQYEISNFKAETAV